MNIDAGRFREIIRAQHRVALSPGDAEAIVALAQLAVDADGREDTQEIKLFFVLGKAVFSLAGLEDTPTPTFAVDEDDHERMLSLASQLATTEARELAYAVAHLLTVADVAIAPEEDAFMESLRTALQIDRDRVAALVSIVSEAIVPASTN